MKLALAYYAYALENPVECLSYLGQVRDLANAQVRLNVTGSLRSSASSAQTRSVSDNTSSVSFIGSFVSSEATPIVADVADGRAWVTIEVVRSVCLKGDPRSSLYCHVVNLTLCNRHVTRKTFANRYLYNSVCLSQCHAGALDHRKQLFTVHPTQFTTLAKFWYCPCHQPFFYEIP